MKNESLYRKTVDILVQSYMNDTLQHGKCTACVVGNLVAFNMGFDIDFIGSHPIWLDKRGIQHYQEWKKVFFTQTRISDFILFKVQHKPKQITNWKEYDGAAAAQIIATGYKPGELAKIEYAFETACRGKSVDEWMFNGLMAVIEVLDVIHENADTSITQTSKERFYKTTYQL